jgi:hypothetical protein
VPKAPGDRGERRCPRLAGIIGAIFAGGRPADSQAARHRLPEVLVVGEPGKPAPGAPSVKTNAATMSLLERAGRMQPGHRANRIAELAARFAG